MGHLSSMFNGLARSFSMRKVKNSNSNSGGNCDGRGAADAMVKDARKNDLILRSSGFVNVDGSNNFASVFSKRGNKGINQDCAIVWEVWISLCICLFPALSWQSNGKYVLGRKNMSVSVELYMGKLSHRVCCVFSIHASFQLE